MSCRCTLYLVLLFFFNNSCFAAYCLMSIMHVIALHCSYMYMYLSEFVSLCTYSVSVAAILSLPPSFHLQFQDPILLLLYQSVNFL